MRGAIPCALQLVAYAILALQCTLGVGSDAGGFLDTVLARAGVPQGHGERLLEAGLATEVELRRASMDALRSAGLKVGHARKLLATLEEMPPSPPPPPPPPVQSSPPPAPPVVGVTESERELLEGSPGGFYQPIEGGGGWGLPAEALDELEAWRKDRRPAGKAPAPSSIWSMLTGGGSEEAAGGRCPLPRIDASSISQSQFHSTYVQGRRPVVITGLGSDWPAHTQWKKASMIERFGSVVTLLTGPPQDLAMWSGAFTGAKHRKTLGEYLGSFGSVTGKPLYEFAHNPMPTPEQAAAGQDRVDRDGVGFFGPAAKHLRSDFDIPPLLSHFATEYPPEKPGGAQTTLNIGDHGSGVPPHVHGEAWITSVYGAKKWFLYAPGTVPVKALPDPLASLQQWETEVLPTLSPTERPLECLQERGETLYFPTGWVHATSNIGEGVAVGMQATYNFEARTETSKRAGWLNATDFFALKDLGIAFKSAVEGTQQGAKRKKYVNISASAYEAALELVPSHWMSYNDLTAVYKTAGRIEDQRRTVERFVASVRAALARTDIPVPMKAIGCETASAAAFFAGNTNDAVRLIRAALEMEPTANRHFKLGLAELTQANTDGEHHRDRQLHLEAAKASFNAALTMDPAHAKAQARLAETKRLLRKAKNS